MKTRIVTITTTCRKQQQNMITLQPHASIDKETVNGLPIESFNGTIHVVETPEAAEAAIATLRQATMLGIDTETKPSFRKGKTNKVSLIQIATENECFLFRINKIGFPPELRDLFTNPRLQKIGLSLKDDFSVLHRVVDFKPQNYIELQTLAKQYGIADMSLQKIYAIIFGKKISKAQRLSNWEAPTLSVPQQYYAALDAWACLHIYNALLQKEPFYINSLPLPDRKEEKNSII